LRSSVLYDLVERAGFWNWSPSGPQLHDAQGYDVAPDREGDDVAYAYPSRGFGYTLAI
jgi:hypothetical protein